MFGDATLGVEFRMTCSWDVFLAGLIGLLWSLWSSCSQIHRSMGRWESYLPNDLSR